MAETPYIYQGPRGIWRLSVERNGHWYWISLRTRDEQKARQKLEEYIDSLEERVDQ